MISKTYFDKCNTIIKNSYYNTGINPIAELNYGNSLTRILFHFSTDKVKKMIEDKTYANVSKLRHILKMTNCGSLDNTILDKKLMTSDYQSFKERAVSFDVILFLIPEEWDGGRGFDYARDLALVGTNNSLSTQGSNWYYRKTGYKWETEGVYSTNTLLNELEKYDSINGNLSKIIVGKANFDYGNENLEIDITEVFNKFLNNEIPNYGLGIAFDPLLETQKTKLSQYIGFFSPYTNSFFEPYIETQYCEYISDDRHKFYLDKPNKLYFYSNIGGFPTNLDELPICKINGSEIASKQATKGVYYIDLTLSSDEYNDNEMIYDLWTNIKYKGKKLKDVELDFVTKSENDFFNFYNSDKLPKKYVPNINGIKYDEKIKRGDIRKLIVDARVPYTVDEIEIIDKMEYRLYVMDGVSEIDVISYEPVERTCDYNYFLINTNDLIPNRYFIDIRISSNLEVRHTRKVLSFIISNDITEKYV